MYERKSGIFPVSAILLVFFMSVNVASANSSQTTTETDQQQDSVLGSWVMVEGFNWKEEPGLPPSEKTHFVSEKDNPAYFLVRAFEESTLQTNVFGSKNERKDCYHTNLDLLAKTDSNIYQNKFGNTHELVLKDNRLHATTRHVSSGVVWERIYERESSFSPKSFLEERCNRASSDSSMFGVWKATSVTFNPGELVLPSEITYIAVTRIFEDAIMLSVYQKHGDCYVAANNALTQYADNFYESTAAEQFLLRMHSNQLQVAEYEETAPGVYASKSYISEPFLEHSRESFEENICG